VWYLRLSCRQRRRGPTDLSRPDRGRLDVAPTQYPGLGTNGAVHGVGMGAIGLWLLDNPDFESLAAACAQRERWAFLATIAPLKLAGGTGSPVNPLALL
jgi:hypothetical protein